MVKHQPFSIIIPVYNEEQAIKQTIDNLLYFIAETNLNIEILAVNDGSTDKTLEILNQFDGKIKIISHPYNKGYGAAIKSGLRTAKFDWVLWYDADGQHQPQEILKLLPYQENFHMIVGQRDTYQGPMLRQPGKKLLSLVANYLSGHKIPDINSGFRLVRKDFALQFIRIYPNSFSISTTITLAFFKEALNIKYVPIEIRKRQGKSTVRIRDGFKTILLVLRIIMLFSPLKIFLPASSALFLIGIIFLIHDIFYFDIGDTSVLFLVSSFLLFFFGLLADQLAEIRRNLK